MASKLGLADRIKDNNCDGNVCREILELVSKYGSLDMSLGLPDFRPPENVLESLSNAAIGENYMLNHYSRAYGHPRLVNALARLYSITLEREIDPMVNINVTTGAFEALFCSFIGLVNPGDEVILIEPFFEPYIPMLRLAGARLVYVQLKPTKEGGMTSSQDWSFNCEEMTKAFNNKTKAIVLTNPSNPLGKVFTLEELTLICTLCNKYDVMCVADEVYEWLVYGGAKHIRMATLPGMWERTLSIGSAGKIFSVTGWRVGWAIGPEHLMKGVNTIHGMALRTNPTPTQEAVAVSIETELSRLNSPECYFISHPREMELKRDLLCNYLCQAGIQAVKPDAGFLIVADISKLDTNGCVSRKDTDEAYDYKFVKWAIKEKKFCTIPISISYSPEHRKQGENYIRICFAKTEETLEKARKLLQDWNN